MKSQGSDGAPIRVLGLDPGSRVTGWGVIDDGAPAPGLVAYGRIILPRAAGRPGALERLQADLTLLLTRFQPQVAVLESSFTARFPKSSLALAEVRGAVLAVLGRWGGTVQEYAPAQMKAAVVGNGRAEKRQVAFIVKHTFGLQEEPLADAADAIALALCYLRLSRLDACRGVMVASGSATWAQLPECGVDREKRRPVEAGGPKVRRKRRWETS